MSIDFNKNLACSIVRKFATNIFFLIFVHLALKLQLHYLVKFVTFLIQRIYGLSCDCILATISGFSALFP